AMLDVADYSRMVVNLFQDFAPAQKPAAGQQIEAQAFVQTAQGVGLAVGVGREPDVGHAAAVDQFLQIESAKLARRGRGAGAGLFGGPEHRAYLSRGCASRYW